MTPLQPPPTPSATIPRGKRYAIFLVVLAAAPLAWLAAAEADDQSNEIALERTAFVARFPNTWKEDVTAPDYQAETYFALNSAQNSYVQFDIKNQPDNVQQVLDNALFIIDGVAITALSKSKFDEWGGYKGSGVHLKGKIMDTYPGGVRVFVFNTAKYNVMVIEYYYSNDLGKVMSEMDFISQNFKLKE